MIDPGPFFIITTVMHADGRLPMFLMWLASHHTRAASGNRKSRP